MSERGRNIVVGFFVLLGLAMLGYLIVKFQATVGLFTAGSDYYIEIQADQTAAVLPGQSIHLNGKPIGNILSVDLAEDPRLGVTIIAAISQQYSIPEDVETASIYQGQLGPPYIEIRALPSHSSVMMPKTPGQVVATLKAHIPPSAFSEISNLVEKLKPALKELGPALAKIGVLADNLNTIIGDEENRENFKQGLANLRQAGQEASAVLEDIKGFTGQASQTTSELGIRMRDVAQAIISNSEQISKLLRNLNKAAEQVNEGEGTAGKILYDPQLYEEMLSTTEELNEAVRMLRDLLTKWNKQGLDLKW